MIQIETYDLNSYQVTQNLDGANYVIQMDWNAQGQCWVMSIDKHTFKLVPFFRLLERFKYNNDLPPGEIVATTQTGMSIWRNDFELWYISESELAELQS